MCRSEEFGRMNVTRVLSGGAFICVNYMVLERRKEEGDIQNR